MTDSDASQREVIRVSISPGEPYSFSAIDGATTTYVAKCGQDEDTQAADEMEEVQRLAPGLHRFDLERDDGIKIRLEVLSSCDDKEPPTPKRQPTYQSREPIPAPAPAPAPIMFGSRGPHILD